MRGLRRAVALATVAVSLSSGLTVAAALPSEAAPVGQALAAPHIYAGGGVLGFGAPQVAPPLALPLNSVMVAMASNPVAPLSDEGYWMASADGGVYTEGNAAYYGSLGALHLTGPVVAMAATPDGRGYWLVALDGGVFAFGDAGFHGSMGGVPLNRPIVGMASTPDGKGYWLVASDGGIFAFGDASFLGSMGGTPLVSAVTGMAPTHNGLGYWLVAGDGGIFTFGAAPFLGSIGGAVLNDPVVGMAAMPDDGGYYMVANDGGIFTFGDAVFRGSLGGGLDGNPHVILPIAGIALTQGGAGYWMLDPDGFNYSFTNPPDPTPSPLASDIAVTAAAQVDADPDPGDFCNPYGPCEEWCSLFATWAWEQAGVPIPSYAFTGDIFTWAQANTGVLPAWATPSVGDAVLYGTGPWSTASSLHVGLVVQVWPDGAVVTVEGDAGPAPTGSLAVVINGPYLPSQSQNYNGVPIYAFAQP
ncbi:MAG TPA: CHAP domain-containing protein [Acidimicrobiales bacterium]